MARGIVYLAGAGPGDAKLLTLRTAELLKKADIVLYDMLIGKKILDMIPRKTVREYVGRAAGDDPSNQDRTNEMMVKYAKMGKRVLRLKGGDPTMFGRGGEEAEYLRSHKVEYEIVPGITSGLASATYSGIPLTHRKYSSSVVFVTGHEEPSKRTESVRWKRMARACDTIVIVMGLSRIRIICKQLLLGGMDKKTPVIVIQDGTTKHKMVLGTISNIASKVKREKVHSPAIIIIGNVVSFANVLGWR
ncbi:MAG: uroporphyrin-III C-methyltransferase [Cenarchaeum symbiont of Oopsacas minuta]|nr:uroporphyrin-III C-methyltransferase [Cenarchaeum symbiont of Oopsacas minuta]